MARGFLSGVAMGVVVSAAGLSGLSVMTMPPSGGVAGATDDIEVSALTGRVPDEGALDAGVPTSDVIEDLQNDTPKMDAPTIGAEPQGDVTPPAVAAKPESLTENAAGTHTADSASEPVSGEGMVKPTDAPTVDISNLAVPDTAPNQPILPVEDAPAVAPMPDAADAGLPLDAPSPLELTENTLDASPPAETDAPVARDITEPAATPKTETPFETSGVKSGPVAPIGDLAPNVKTNRLPSIADEAPQAAPEAAIEPPLSETETSPLAIIRNAIDFERADELPVIAIMLKDEGGARDALGDLSTLPFPVTFVVDATVADAAEAVAYYRAQGIEVVVEVALPPASTPADAEVNFQVQAPIVDQGVAVLMNEVSGFQEDTDLAKQVAQILAASGHGLVSVPKGLSTGNRLAIKAGVPAATIFRDLDGAGQDRRTIRRFLDNAAFKARQTDRVILFGRARPETLQALIEWSLGNRAKSVSVAPVSVVLKDGQ